MLASKTKTKTALLLLLILVLQQPGPAEARRIRGTYSSKDFFSFLAKFGFQKTEISSRESTQGFIFGNVTLSHGSGDNNNNNVNTSSSPPLASLVVLDRGYFLEFYGNRTLSDKRKACAKMFHKLSRAAYDVACYPDGEEDFIRTVPCPRGQVCPDEDNPKNVIPGYQFTYRIQDLYQSRFWYVSLVSCYRNRTTCSWEPTETEHDFEVDLDLWLVNGSPGDTNKNPFRYQYSFDNQDLFSVYLFLLLVYSVVLPIQYYANLRQQHPITRLLLAGLVIEFVALLSTNLHHAIYAVNGIGLPWLGTCGDIIEIFSQSLFMLLLLLLAMGWAVTRREIKCKAIIFSVWLTYSVVHCLLYIWKKTEIDVIEDIDEFQTIPGVLILFLRVLTMLTFLLSLRDTMLHETSETRLNFFLHFGASSLVWFIYLPIMAIIALQISALWRAKFIIGVIYSADTFAYVVMVHLLWPNRSEQYFLLAVQDDPGDELEVLCEAPNQIDDDSDVNVKRRKSKKAKASNNVNSLNVPCSDPDASSSAAMGAAATAAAASGSHRQPDEAGPQTGGGEGGGGTVRQLIDID